MRGQAAVEYLMIVSIVLTMLTILTYYAQDMTEANMEDIVSSNAIIAVNKIAEASDIVDIQGDSSQITLSVYIPEKVNSIEFSNNMMIMKIGTGPNYNDILATSRANFTDDSFISPEFGTKRVKIRAVNVNGVSYVNVTQV